MHKIREWRGVSLSPAARLQELGHGGPRWGIWLAWVRG